MLEIPAEKQIPPIIYIPPVGDGRQVDDHVWIDFVGDCVGYPHQLDEIFDCTAPRLKACVPDVGFVPDDPVTNASGVVRHQLADECSPGVLRVIVGEVQSCRDTGTSGVIHSPAGCGDDQPDDLASGGAFSVEYAVGDRIHVPFSGVVRLDLIPFEGDARPAGAECIGSLGCGVTLHDAKAPVGNTGGCDWVWPDQGEQAKDVKRKT